MAISQPFTFRVRGSKVALGVRLVNVLTPTITTLCCGVGNVMSEVLACGMDTVGGDIVRCSVQAAAANLRAAWWDPCAAVWDAGRLPLQSAGADQVVSQRP